MTRLQDMPEFRALTPEKQKIVRLIDRIPHRTTGQQLVREVVDAPGLAFDRLWRYRVVVEVLTVAHLIMGRYPARMAKAQELEMLDKVRDATLARLAELRRELNQ
jgi:hypothetical protein